jgi:DNA (cytosine-5)-methyltransferase 1
MAHTTKACWQLKAVDFFCGVGGMSYGLHKAGIDVLGGVDLDDECQQTYEANIPNAKFLSADITSLDKSLLANTFKIEVGDDALIFAGCSPCQFWSKVRTDKGKSERTAFLLKHFEFFIEHFRPGFVVVENVPGLLTKKDRSILPQFLTFLTNQGYVHDDGIIDAKLYGVPQHRSRYLLIATRIAKSVELPKGRKNKKLTVRRIIGGLAALAAGERAKRDKLHRAAGLTKLNLARIRRTPSDGGDRSSWRDDPQLQLRAYVGRDDIFKDVYGRMYWGRVSPTITTRFNSLSNGRFGHPEQDRALTLREGALLQTFPKSFKFCSTNQASIARQIGNAVPPELARRIGCYLNLIANCG